MEQHPAFLILVKVTIFTLMLALGVNVAPGRLLAIGRSPTVLLRSLLAVVVLVPAAVGLLLWLLALPREVATGLAVLAAAPGAPLTTMRARMAGGTIPYTASLQLSLAVLAVLVTPLLLGVFYWIFDLATENVTPAEIARQVAIVQLLPVAIGLLLQRFAPRITAVVGKPLMQLANGLFLLLVLLLLVPAFRILVHFGMLPILTIVVMVAASLAIGHGLGGSDPHERASLSVACIARNIGLALLIAGLSDAQKQLVPTLIAYMIVGAVVAVPYSLWSKRRIAQLEAA